MIINVMHEGGAWHGDPSVTSVTTHVPSSQRQPSHPPTWAKNITTTSLNDNPCNAKYIFCKQSTPTTRATFALTFIKTILVSICPLAVAWGLCQNQRGRTSSDVWAACVRGPAFCFLAEDFSSFFLHLFVSSLEIPFGKQVYNSYLHKIRKTTWQIALLLLIAQKHYFLSEALNIKEVSAQWARSEQQNPPFLHISHFCYGWGCKKNLRRVAYHF